MKRLLLLVKQKGKIKLLPDNRIIIYADTKAAELLEFTKNVLMELVTV